MKHVFFRVDSSPQIGSGHLMRCLAVAEGLPRDSSAVFICRAHPGNMAHLARERGVRVEELPFDAASVRSLPPYTAWLGASEAVDAAQTSEAIGRFGPGIGSTIITDHYGVTADWQRTLKPRAAHLVCIDDLAAARLDCHIVLNSSPGADLRDRYAGKVNHDCRLLLGARFALLRKEFREAKKRARSGEVQRLLVALGGADEHNVTARVLNAVSGLNIHIDVVIGAAYPYSAALTGSKLAVRSITIHRQSAEMALLMNAADLAILGAGLTSLERLAMSLPAITLSLAENQDAQGQALAAAGTSLHLGRAETVSAAHLRSEIDKLLASPEALQRMSGSAASMNVGFGVPALLAHLGLKPLNLRPATIGDAAPLLAWRNDALTRESSRDPREIGPSEHRQWLTSALRDPDRSILIAELDGVPMGTVRAEPKVGARELSWNVAPEFRGMGLGAIMLRSALEVIPLPVRAVVRESNAASLRIAAAAGLKQVETKDGFTIWQ